MLTRGERRFEFVGISTFVALLPGRTTWCESPAITSTSSGGRTTRLVATTGASDAAVMELSAAGCDAEDCAAGAGAETLLLFLFGVDGATSGRATGAEAVLAAESVFAIVAGAETVGIETSSQPNQNSRSFTRTTVRATSNNVRAISRRVSCLFACASGWLGSLLPAFSRVRGCRWVPTALSARLRNGLEVMAISFRSNIFNCARLCTQWHVTAKRSPTVLWECQSRFAGAAGMNFAAPARSDGVSWVGSCPELSQRLSQSSSPLCWCPSWRRCRSSWRWSSSRGRYPWRPAWFRGQRPSCPAWRCPARR